MKILVLARSLRPKVLNLTRYQMCNVFSKKYRTNGNGSLKLLTDLEDDEDKPLLLS